MSGECDKCGENDLECRCESLFKGLNMIKWIKSFFFLLGMYRKQKKLESDLYNAKKHALLSLAYWKDCAEECDLNFQIEQSSIYVRLGKANTSQADEKINSEKIDDRRT